MSNEATRATCNRKAKYPSKAIAKDVARRRVSQQYRAGKRGG